MISSSFPRRGEVYLVPAIKAIGDTKKRPSIIVSRNTQNQYSPNVIVVPLTSSLEGIALPTRVLIRSGQGGIDADSLATCDRIVTVKKAYLERGPFGVISHEMMERIVVGVQAAIAGDYS